MSGWKMSLLVTVGADIERALETGLPEGRPQDLGGFLLQSPEDDASFLRSSLFT